MRRAPGHHARGIVLAVLVGSACAREGSVAPQPPVPPPSAPGPVAPPPATAPAALPSKQEILRTVGDEPERAALRPTPRPPSADGRGLRRRVLARLGGYEHTPTREELADLGSADELASTLAAIYGDATLHLAVRIQALASLRFFPGPKAKAAMETALFAADTTDAARRSAAKAYGAAFGVEAVPALEKLLVHPDLHTRDAAARTLGRIPGDRAKRALRERLAAEPEATVRETIEAGLR